MALDQRVLEEVRRVASTSDEPGKITNHLLSILLWHRARQVEQLILQYAADGQVAVVQNGVFKGLRLALPVHAGHALPMMTGSYEAELHPYIAAAIKRGYPHVVNIGCGDGYYLVGMARQMPQSQFFGHDLNPAAQEGCRVTAINNNVAERVTVGGLFNGDDFAQHPAGQTLIICDIEGGEDALLDPARYPALKGHDLIVELHEMCSPGVTQRVRQRFAATHDIMTVDHAPKQACLPPALQNLAEVDQFLCTFEGRDGPTPWLIMTTK